MATVPHNGQGKRAEEWWVDRRVGKTRGAADRVNEFMKLFYPTCLWLSNAALVVLMQEGLGARAPGPEECGCAHV